MKLLAASIFLASASLALADWSGWNPDAYNANHTTTGVVAFASNQVADVYAITNSVTYTNEVAPGVFTTLTYSAIAKVQVDIPPWGKTNVVSFTLPLTRYTATTNCSGGICTTTYVASVTDYAVTWSQAMQKVTVKVQARDAWVIDMVRALRERAAAAGVDPYNPADWLYFEFSPPVTIYDYPSMYSNDQEILSFFKLYTKKLIPYFVNTNALSAVAITNEVEMLTVTGLLAQISAPTNYLDYTAWAQLGGDGTNFEQRVTTRQMIQSCSGTNACTNYTRISGVTYTNVATNGAAWAVTTTNANILAGYSSRDYGWMYMRRVLEAMTHTKSDGYTSTNTTTIAEYYDCENNSFEDTGTSGSCAYLWSTRTNLTTNTATDIDFDNVNQGELDWYVRVDQAFIEKSGGSYDDAFADLGCSNYIGVANIKKSKPTSYAFMAQLDPHAIYVVSNMAPSFSAYRKVATNSVYASSILSTWPAFTMSDTSNRYEYVGDLSTESPTIGLIGVGAATNVLVVGPASDDLALGYDDCDYVNLTGDLVEGMTVTSGTNVWEFSGGGNLGLIIGVRIDPLTVINWGTTNAFRYR